MKYRIVKEFPFVYPNSVFETPTNFADRENDLNWYWLKDEKKVPIASDIKALFQRMFKENIIQDYFVELAENKDFNKHYYCQECDMEFLTNDEVWKEPKWCPGCGNLDTIGIN